MQPLHLCEGGVGVEDIYLPVECLQGIRGNCEVWCITVQQFKGSMSRG
jgi:hypothetical protein